MSSLSEVISSISRGDSCACTHVAYVPITYDTMHTTDTMHIEASDTMITITCGTCAQRCLPMYWAIVAQPPLGWTDGPDACLDAYCSVECARHARVALYVDAQAVAHVLAERGDVVMCAVWERCLDAYADPVRVRNADLALLVVRP